MRSSTIIDRVTAAVAAMPRVREVAVELDVFSDEQRAALREKLQGPARDIVFTRPGNTTRIIGVSSGKGGVGKSSLTVNLAVALAAQGKSVGILDADIYGHSVPKILGIDRYPTRVEGMIMPPSAHGVQAISMLMFQPGGLPRRWPTGADESQTALAVPHRGPLGDLDVLLIDLPPGTGDMAISEGQLLPASELLVITTPQQGAADVAVRAGMMALHTSSG